MESFLKHIASDLYSRYKDDISNLCIVFPNRRASLYFKKYLSELSDKPMWSPVTTTINELMQEISGLTTADNIKLLFELFRIYKQIKKSDESFDDFYFWGEMMLNDFDDIDKYLVNPEDLFKNLKSLKSIQDQFNYLSDDQIEAIKQFWQSFEPEKQRDHQDEFISIWNALLEIYQQFNKKLTELGIAYEGMIYRTVADKIKGNEKIELPRTKYVFAGFNALNNCEKKFFNYLNNNKLADFYWDYDQSYINNHHHEAGFFLRENINQFNQPISISNKDIFKSLSQKKNIEVISVPSDVGQAKVITQKLQESNENIAESPNKTAIVLADEELLVPVLHSIPDTVDKVNITMGYPVNNTPVYSLLEHIIELQRNAKESKNGITFYHKNVVAILNHQYLNSQFTKEANELLQFIKKNNKIVITREELASCDFFKVIFTKINTYTELSEYILDILHQIYNSLKKSGQENTIHTTSLEKEYIYHIYLSINRVKDVLQEQQIEIKIETYIRLIRKIIRNLRIPFTGEPLSGLQIMGILETRLLDFENLFITSVNEGVFPKTEASLSFIPYNLRRGFGLPTIEHQDAIYAYYFYRLLQRAKNITLLYNSNSDGMQTGEMSRFLYQLKYESDFDIKEKSLKYDINITQPKEIEIQKSEAIIEKLKKFQSSGEGKKYLSPSALSTYLRCSLQFYFRYIAELREQDELTEEIDAPLFGNILHQAMNYLYEDFVGKEINSEIIKNLLKDSSKISSAIDQAFTDEYFKTSNKINYSGKNIIIRELIEKYILQILKVDDTFTPFEIISLEDTYEVEIPVNSNGTSEMVKLGGKIDRIDKQNNRVRIIDYKTGNDKLEFKNIEALFSDKKGDQNSAVFQTFLYSLFYLKDKKPQLPVTPGVYSVRKIYDKNFDYRIYNKDTKLHIENYNLVNSDFSEHITQLVNDIFNPDISFTQTEETRNCEYCDFKKICHK
ncbi:MAG: PD-(D/E)XK nuclease family protein [Bacteroidales bacterium]|nr:PD-(D/E)XK nuclease family protein [Bacteroidales bacterium]